MIDIQPTTLDSFSLLQAGVPEPGGGGHPCPPPPGEDNRRGIAMEGDATVA